MGASDSSVSQKNISEIETNIKKYFSDTNITKNELVNDIYTAYSKVYNIAQEVVTELNEQNDVNTNVNVNQSNVASGVISGNDGGGVTVDQRNEANITLALKVVMQRIQQTDASSTVKSIMADMLALTQDQQADTDNKNKSDSSVKDTTTVDQGQTNEKYTLPSFAIKRRESFVPIGMMLFASNLGKDVLEGNIKEEFLAKLLGIDCVGIFCDNSTNTVQVSKKITNEDQTFEKWNETENKNKNIQSYIQSLEQKFDQKTKTISNLSNNITIGLMVEQTNVFNYDIINNKNYNPVFKQANKVAEEITASYENFLNQVSKAVQDIITEASTNTTESQGASTTTKNDNEATSNDDVDAGVTQKSSNKDISKKTMIIGIVVAVVVVVVVAMVLLIIFLKRSHADEMLDAVLPQNETNSGNSGSTNTNNENSGSTNTNNNSLLNSAANAATLAATFSPTPQTMLAATALNRLNSLNNKPLASKATNYTNGKVQSNGQTNRDDYETLP